MHIGKVKFLLAFLLEDLSILLAEIVSKEILLRPLGEFLLVHHDGGSYPGVSHLCSDDIALKGIVIFHLLLQILRTIKVQRILLQVIVGYRCCLLHLPSRL